MVVRYSVVNMRKARLQVVALSRAARSGGTHMIKQVYEVAPLICSHCAGEMRFLAVIDEALVIERTLQHGTRGICSRFRGRRPMRKTGRTISRSR